MPSYILREVQEQDGEPVMEIFNHYVTTGFAAYPDHPMPPGFFDVLSDGAHAFPVIERDGDIVGIGIVKPFLPFFTFSHTTTVSTFIAPATGTWDTGQSCWTR